MIFHPLTEEKNLFQLSVVTGKSLDLIRIMLCKSYDSRHKSNTVIVGDTSSLTRPTQTLDDLLVDSD